MREMIANVVPGMSRVTPTVLPVVPMVGAIGGGGMGRGLSLAALQSQLETAFKTKSAPAVALAINSPGGSPVQSTLIHNRVRALAEEHGKPVLAFVEDLGASGGYILACAGDEIIADPSSIVGSIGVLSGGFGFSGLMERLGVDRRLYTAGDNKAALDPFSPEDPEAVARLDDTLKALHDEFIALVRERRGERLREDAEPALFSGEVWPGRRALEIGLIDGLGHLDTVLRKRFGSKIKIKRLTRPRSLASRVGLSAQTAAGTAPGIADPQAWLDALETRALWGRYGL